MGCSNEPDVHAYIYSGYKLQAGHFHLTPHDGFLLVPRCVRTREAAGRSRGRSDQVMSGPGPAKPPGDPGAGLPGTIPYLAIVPGPIP